MKIDNPLRELKRAAAGNCYPKVFFDFGRGREISFDSYREFESGMHALLTSRSNDRVKDGLANVLYWGLYRMGIRDTRVKRFRSEVSSRQLAQARSLFRNLAGNGLKEIAALKLPQFSMMPFVSKIRMFLDPQSFVVLDNKLAKLSGRSGFFARLTKTKNETSIRLTNANVDFYDDWCGLCVHVAKMMKTTEWIAVDAERGIFSLIDTGKTERAASLVTHFHESYAADRKMINHCGPRSIPL